MRETEDNAAYMREWRKTPEGKESLRRQRERRDARQAAYRRLEALHHHDFLVLFNEELAKRKVS